MSISLRAATDNVPGGTTSPISCGKPAGVVSGDVMVACVQTTGLTGASATGWTVLDNSASVGGQTITTLYKVAGGSEAASYSFNAGGTDQAVAVVISAFRGVDTTTPINAHTTGTRSPSATTFVCPSVTTTAANCMLVFGCSEIGGASSTFPAGSTEDIDDSVALGGGCHAGHEQLSATGATGTRTITLSSTDTGWTYTVALKPGASTSPPTITVVGQAAQRAAVI